MASVTSPSLRSLVSKRSIAYPLAASALVTISLRALRVNGIETKMNPDFLHGLDAC